MDIKKLKRFTAEQLLKVLHDSARFLEHSYQQTGEHELWLASLQAEEAYDFLLSDYYSKRKLVAVH